MTANALALLWNPTLRCVLLAAGLLLLVGCGESGTAPAAPLAPAAADGLTVVDDLGRTVVLPRRPQRIATTASFAVEYLVALGRPPVLRPDVPAEEVHPAEAAAIPALAVSHSVGPNLEQLAAAQPDLVITSPTFARFVAPIEQTLGVPVLVYEIDALADVAALAEAMGALVGEPEAGRELAASLRASIEAVQPPAGGEPPRVFAMFGTPQAFYAFRPESYLGGMITALGGRLVRAGAAAPGVGESSQLTPFSLEVLVAEDPDVILMVHHGPPGEQAAALAEHPTWSTLRAVRAGRVHRISQADFLTSPGPRAAEAMRRLLPLLYPESGQ